MNLENFSRDDLIEGLGPAPAAVFLVIGVALWTITLLARKRFPAAAVAFSLAGFVLATAVFWLGFQFLGKVFSLATSWPLIVVALIGGASVEAVLWLYGFEKSLVSKVRGRTLLALRLVALVLLLLVLAQPVRSFLEEREIDREIAILVDESDSMLLADQRLSASEKLDRAALFGVASVQDRPPLREVGQLAREIDDALSRELDAVQAAPSLEAGLENRSDRLPEFFDGLGDRNTELTDALDKMRERRPPGDVAGRIDDYLKRSRDGLTRILAAARQAAESDNPDEFVRQLNVAREELDGILETISSTVAAADDAFYEDLDQEARDRVDEAAATPRIEISRRVLEAPLGENEPGRSDDSSLLQGSLLDRLAADYNLRLYRFSRDVEQIANLEDWDVSGTLGAAPANAQTDLTGAIEHVIENTSPESLAGVLLLSDGRHNTADLPEDGLRQLAVQNTPLSAVPIGGDIGPVDISLLDLAAPESIYLDDRVVVAAEAKLNGFLGEKVTAELISGGEVVDTATIDATDVNFRTELRFVHRPEEKGIVDYRVRLEPDEREIFQDNNVWDFKVAVTDDRTNVLLVDGLPRWEFRYLRNLFYGRDKSVHLQYVLLDPDEIARSRGPEPIAASATRPFGEAEATRLPTSPKEWQLFDVIILGDIPPAALGIRDWLAIEEAVTRRGALLLCVAGPRYMPHGHDSDVLQNLLPITYDADASVRFDSPEPAYKIELSSAGRNHPVTSQSSSPALNLDRWASFPAMDWRFTGGEVKDTAEVLAYARPVGTPSIAEALSTDGSPDSVEAAIEQLANRQEFEQDHALVSTIRAGLGKVMMMHFDQTWRFRYGVGDTYHHRFWGQVTRWGAGPNLRSGNEFVRVGTDRLSYTPSDPVEVTAKVLDEERRPVTDTELDVEAWKDGERFLRQRLSYRSDSSGLYETSLGGLSGEGEYELKLVGDAVARSVEISDDGSDEVATELLVLTTRNPIELAELTADRDFLNRAAGLTGGRVAELHNLETLLSSFGEPKETLVERRNVTLWDTWPMLLAFLGFLTTEWILRRRSGLV
ncbi:MAG: DMT family transporter [Verrucomicrobiales bacterium]